MEPRTASASPSYRAPLIGGALALAIGLTAGGFLKAGDLFPTSQPAAAPMPAEADDGVITFATNADGRVPDYVVGTDVTAGPVNAGFQPAAYAPDATPVEDWSSAPSMSGDILAMGGASAQPATGSAAFSVDDHAIDASEVAASGATARAERKPDEAKSEPTSTAADRRDGQAALAAAGFTTTTP